MVNARVFRLTAAGEIDGSGDRPAKNKATGEFHSGVCFIKLRDRCRLTTRRRHAEKRAGIRRKDNHIVAIPGAARGSGSSQIVLN